MDYVGNGNSPHRAITREADHDREYHICWAGCDHVTVYLLCVHGKAVPGAAAASVELKTGTGHILFVVDEQLQLDLSSTMLPISGYRVTTTLSSSKALELFRGSPDGYDLVIDHAEDDRRSTGLTTTGNPS